MNPEIRQLEKDYVEHRIIAADIAKDLDISTQTWYSHIKYHLTPQVIQALSVNAEVMANQVVDKIGSLIDILDILGKEIENAQDKTSIVENDKRMKALTGLIAEKRKTIEVMAKLQGEYKDSAVIKVSNINIEYNNIMGMVMQDACPMCKQKFAEKIPNIIKVVDENSS